LQTDKTEGFLLEHSPGVHNRAVTQVLRWVAKVQSVSGEPTSMRISILALTMYRFSANFRPVLAVAAVILPHHTALGMGLTGGFGTISPNS
jgi:hypothetical protein